MTDLIERLRKGCMLHPKRWTGDTHDDMGGSVDDIATDALMLEAATALEAAREEIEAHERNDVGYIDTIERQSREREAAQDDADRYRHLRDYCGWVMTTTRNGVVIKITAPHMSQLAMFNKGEFDAAIDAAIAQEEPASGT